MTYPKEFFQASAEAERAATAFAIMPFARRFDPVYRAISTALQKPEIGFTCGRADQLFGGHEIMLDVLRAISRAQLIIADLTGRNPNVFYELGVAHMVKDATRVILLSQDIEDVPFDLRAYRCIIYSTTEAGLRKLANEIAAAARMAAGTYLRFGLVPNGGYDTPAEFPGPDRCLYSFHLSQAMLGRGLVKCYVKVVRHAVGERPTTVMEGGVGILENESRRPYDQLPWCLRLESADEQSASFAIVPG